MNKRQRGYLDLLRERCGVLRYRVEAGASHKLAYVDNWRRELRAMEWALSVIEAYGSVAKGPGDEDKNSPAAP